MSSPLLTRMLTEMEALAPEERDVLRAKLDELDDDTPQEEIDAAWEQEIARRLQRIKDGTAVLHDHDDVMRELDEIVRRFCLRPATTRHAS
jgi:hypothetical protein